MDVFISHITEEKDLALLLQERISEDFIGAVDVFVSSDNQSIGAGKIIVNEITQALKTADIALIICSKQSIARPWVNFESGAAWIRGIDPIPVCHTNITPSGLPPPYGVLNGVLASEAAGIETIYRTIAKKGGFRFPAKADIDGIVRDVRAFERKYGYIGRIRDRVQEVLRVFPDLQGVFQPNTADTAARLEVEAWQIDEARSALNFLKQDGLLDYSQQGGARQSMIVLGNRAPTVTTYTYIIDVFQKYYDVAAEVMNQ